MALQSTAVSSPVLFASPLKSSRTTCSRSDLTNFELSLKFASPSKRLIQVRCDSANNSSESREKWHSAVGKCTVGIAAAAILLTGNLNLSSNALAEDGLNVYYGTAASASSYGGYGGNSSKKDSAEYTYEVPSGWKERAISKVEKGTNGTDSEFYNPRKRTEKVYTTFLAGFRKLPPKDNVLSNLALSDVNLQDLIASADSVNSVEKIGDDGQLYYEFEINSSFGHSLISVTCARNKLYAHFVNATSADWNKDIGLLTYIHNSFKTTPVY